MSAPPPSSAPPAGMNRDVVEIVRKKMAAPSGPPPPGMRGPSSNTSNSTAFSAPKKINERDRQREAIVESDDTYPNDSYSYDDADYDKRNANSNHRGGGSSSSATGRSAGAKDFKLEVDEEPYNHTYAPSGYRSKGNGDRGKGHKDSDRREYTDEYTDYDRGYGDDRDYGDEDEEDYYDEEGEEDGGGDWPHEDDRNGRHDNKSNLSPKPRPKDPNQASREWGDDAHIHNGSQAKGTDSVTDGKGGFADRPMSVAAAEIRNQQGVSAALATLRGSGASSQPPGRLVLFNFQKILTATYRELKTFVTSPCPPGVTIRCYIERNRSGTKMLAPFYSICADLEDGTGRELMVCRKIMRSRSPHYVFSLKMDDLWLKREQRSRLFLGKLRATTSCEYVMYDNGICPAPDDSKVEDEELGPTVGDVRSSTALARKFEKESKAVGTAQEASLYRKELVVIHYNTKSRPCQSGVRGMEVCIPNTFTAPADEKSTTAQPNHQQVFNIVKPFDKLRQAGKQNEMFAKSCFVLHERNSRYDPLSSCLVDFKGRANMASVKNCQLVESSPANAGASTAVGPIKADQDKEFKLQLGKTTEDCFNMDLRHPLSLLQAFAISISRFDANLSW